MLQKIKFLVFVFLILQISLCAQNLGIGPDTFDPDPSAGVEMQFTNKGLLIPRVALTNTSSASPITSPANSLLVYNTATTGDVTPGYYYWNGSKWMRLLAIDDKPAWLLVGNAGTTPGTNFIGTTDAKDLVFKTNSTEKMRITSGGNVGIGTNTPAEKLEIAGYTRTYGLRTSVMTTGAEMVYIRGTGLNHNANRLVKIGNSTLVNDGSRGLTLTIINASTHAHVSSTNYDTYGSTAASDNLATALNNLTRDQIGILTSFDAIEESITSNLRSAALRLGLFKLAASPSGSRRPYAAIFYGSGTGTGNTESGRQAIEVFQSDDTDAPYAIITCWLTEDGFTGQTLTNALVSGEPNTSYPAVFVNSNSNVGIGTTTPAQKLDVSGGNIRTTGQLMSTIATGTSPLSVASTTLVTNLNADMLDGYHYSSSWPNPSNMVTGSGTANYVSKWTGTYTQGNSIIYDNGTNVGIGTTSPAEKLHINGSIRGDQSGALRINTGSGYIDIGPKNTSWAHFYTDRSRYWFSTGLTVETGNIGSYDEDLSLQTSGTTRITILNSNGNVGIGTTTPTQKLHVQGNIRATSLASGANGAIVRTNTNGDMALTNFTGSATQVLLGNGTFGTANTSETAWQLTGNAGTTPGTNFIGTTDAKDVVFKTNNSEIMRITSGGNVGINATNPGEKLQVGGDVYITGGGGTIGGATMANGWLKLGTGLSMDDNEIYFGTNGYIGTIGAFDLLFKLNGGERMRITSSGNVGIGTTTPAQKLDVDGNIKASGVAYWGNSGTRTETRNDAGAMGVGTRSGFYETSAPAPAANWPTGATGWWHLLDIRHCKTTNNYAMQFAGSFFDQNLYFRKTNNNAAQPWSQVYTSANGGLIVCGAANYVVKSNGSNGVCSQIYDNGTNVGIGTTSFEVGEKFAVSNGTTKFGIFPGYLDNVADNNWVTLDIPGYMGLRVWDNFSVSGNVGIGTTTPQRALHVASSTSYFNDGFEDGSLSPFTTGGNANWATSTTSPYAGSY